jgi:hypothetical protein
MVFRSVAIKIKVTAAWLISRKSFAKRHCFSLQIEGGGL